MEILSVQKRSTHPHFNLSPSIRKTFTSNGLFTKGYLWKPDTRMQNTGISMKKSSFERWIDQEMAWAIAISITSSVKLFIIHGFNAIIQLQQLLSKSIQIPPSSPSFRWIVLTLLRTSGTSQAFGTANISDDTSLGPARQRGKSTSSAQTEQHPHYFSISNFAQPVLVEFSVSLRDDVTKGLMLRCDVKCGIPVSEVEVKACRVRKHVSGGRVGSGRGFFHSQPDKIGGGVGFNWGRKGRWSWSVCAECYLLYHFTPCALHTLQQLFLHYSQICMTEC